MRQSRNWCFGPPHNGHSLLPGGVKVEEDDTLGFFAGRGGSMGSNGPNAFHLLAVAVVPATRGGPELIGIIDVGIGTVGVGM